MSGLSEMQKKHLSSLVKSGAFEFKTDYFKYDSHEIAPYKFNTEAILEAGALWGEICKDIIKDIQQKKGLEFDVIAGGRSIGGKSMGWMFSGMTSVTLEKPYLNIYKDKTTSRTDVNNKKVLFMGDYLHAGSNIIQIWQPAIQKKGGNLKEVYFYMDKNEGGKERLEDLGIKVHSFLELNDEAWNYILEQNNLSEEVHKTMQAYRQNPEQWIRTKIERILSKFELSKEEQEILRAYPKLSLEIKDKIYNEIC